MSFHHVLPGDELAAIIRKYYPNPYHVKVLDCGCGKGFWSDYLVELGLEYTGIDKDNAAIDFARKQHPARRFTRADLWDFGSCTPYDLAVLIDVLAENTPQGQEGIIEMLGAVLRHGGMVFVVEPVQPAWCDLFDKFGFERIEKGKNMNVFRKVVG